MPPDLSAVIKIFEQLAQVFGASIAPILFALWIWTQRPKDKPIDTSPFDRLREDMLDQMGELKRDMRDVRDRVAKIEGGLGL